MAGYQKNMLWVLLVCVFPVFLSGQTTRIQGKIPGGEGVLLTMSTYSDYISYKLEVLDACTIDDRGDFTLEVDLTDRRLVFLELRHYSIGLFVEQGGEYIVSCDTIDVKDEYRPMYNKDPLPCRIDLEPEPGLNALISGFNGAFNEFVLQEFSGIYQRRNTNILNEFRQRTQNTYSTYNIPYLDQYIDFKIAGVEIAMAPAKKAALFSGLLDNHTILYHHPEYMAFFHAFFDQHLYPDNRYIPRIDLYNTINYLSDYAPLMDSLGKDSTLVNEKLRELVCINLMNELYNNPDFSKDGIVKILSHIEQNSKYREHRSIARNVRLERTKLEKGYRPPAITLQDVYGNEFNFDSLHGKPVYLSFVTTWSYGCLKEMELMEDLRAEYKDRIHFVSISFDEDVEVVKSYINDKGFDWVFLYNGTSPGLISDFRIKTFPVFMLLDTQGKLYEYPAFKPSEIIRESFDRLLTP